MAQVGVAGLRVHISSRRGAWVCEPEKQTQRVASDGCAPAKVRLGIAAEERS